MLTGSHEPRTTSPAFLQILDIESAEVFEAFQEECTFAGHADILHRCIIERTPSRGAHLGFLCRVIDDKQKLTIAHRKADNKILIELLQHQCCTVAPTAIPCKPEHPVGAAYRLIQGSWAAPREISPEQRRSLLDVAHAFNEVPEKIVRGAQLDARVRAPGCCGRHAELASGASPQKAKSAQGRVEGDGNTVRESRDGFRAAKPMLTPPL